MGNIKNYIRLKVKNLHEQNERIKEREEQGEKLDDKLSKLLDKYNDDKITYEQFIELSEKLTFAYIFGDGYFFDELDRRENDNIAEQNLYEKLTAEDIQKLRPIDLAKQTKDYIEKKGLFEIEST